MAGRFYFGDDSAAPDLSIPAPPLSDDEDTTTLPFPQPLARPSFLTPDFGPHTFLSSLSNSNRFQTLEDLQAELRDLSATINRELVDLVNENYEEFVNLGVELRGGEEKVEEIRVGLLGFEKDVRGLRGRVDERREEVSELLGRKRQIRKEIGIGRGLLEIDERLEDLEFRVGLKEREKRAKNADEQNGEETKWSEEWAEESIGESDQDYDEDDAILQRPSVLVEKYLIIKTLAKRYDPGHPFIVAQKDRIHRIQDRIRVEVQSAILSEDDTSTKQKLIQLRGKMDD